MTELSIWLIQFVSLFAVVWLGAEIFGRGFRRNSLELIVICIYCATSLFRISLVLAGNYEPLAYFLFTAYLFVIGPSLLFLVRRILHSESAPVNFRQHFIPAALVVLGEVFFQALPVAEKETFIITMNLPGFNIHKLPVLLGGLHVLTYHSSILFSANRLRRQVEFRHMSEAILMVSLTLAGSAMLLFGFVIGTDWLMHVGSHIVGVVIIAVFFYSFRYPDLLYSLEEDAKSRYTGTPLTGLDVNAVSETLDRLLNEERIYLNPTLRLSELAASLDLTPHQLSRIINESHGKNFASLINEYRIREACRIFDHEPEAKVTGVVYRIGFNSASAFHEQFKRYTGKSPAAYRKKTAPPD